MDDQFNKQRTRQHEGTRLRVYADTLGISTIGVGFNLEDPQARAICSAVGVDYEATLNGKPITMEECDAIFDRQYAEVQKSARALFPDIDAYPRNAAAVICDMLFQLGPVRFSKFFNTIQAFRKRDWAAAIQGIQHSALAQQTPQRVSDNISLLATISGLGVDAPSIFDNREK